MEEYFKPRIEIVENKITLWNRKTFFQRLISKNKWSEEDFCDEIEKIFHLDVLDQIKTKDDFNIYLKYFLNYHKALTNELFFSITEKLLMSNHLNPKVEIVLKEFIKAKKESLKYHEQSLNLINELIK